MFTSDHEIWKFAYGADELSDWLDYAEELVGKWSNQGPDEIEFKSTFDIILASLLLMDNLLPSSARIALARLLLDVISEADKKKIRVECLKVEPPSPGRKKDRTAIIIRFREVKQLLDKGYKKTEAYNIVAEKHHKSPDTIRREFQRQMKKIRSRNKGEIDK